jgi:hypothetical protein
MRLVRHVRLVRHLSRRSSLVALRPDVAWHVAAGPFGPVPALRTARLTAPARRPGERLGRRAPAAIADQLLNDIKGQSRVPDLRARDSLARSRCSLEPQEARARATAWRACSTTARRYAAARAHADQGRREIYERTSGHRRPWAASITSSAHSRNSPAGRLRPGPTPHAPSPPTSRARSRRRPGARDAC